MMTVAAWLLARKRPRGAFFTGGLLAFGWNVPALLLLNVAAQRYGWWHFDAQGGLLLGVPVDFLLAWAWLWSVVALLAFPTLALGAVVMIALMFDLVLMPAAAPVLQLGPSWILGEAVGLLAGLVPGLLLARWTMRDERLVERAALQVLAFSGLALFVLPAIVNAGTGVPATRIFEHPVWLLSLIAQVLGIPAVIGLSAVQEFVTRGGGTPVPFDPPRRIVTSGIYCVRSQSDAAVCGSAVLRAGLRDEEYLARSRRRDGAHLLGGARGLG